MRILRDLAAPVERPLALTIGNFDGVHLGHRAMIKRLIDAARGRGLSAAVMIFEPQPQEFFAPDQAPARLTRLREKLELLAATGVDRTYVCRFDFRLAQLTAEAFVHSVLHDAMQVKWLLVGDDFRFGARRGGNFDLLVQLAPKYGYEVEAMHSVVQGGERVSSTAVRMFLEAGDLDGSERLLGRRYAICGRVVGGESLGAKLGYPTANVQLKRVRSPLSGIFVVEVQGLGARAIPGVASLGVRPTITVRGRPTLEVHLFDFDQRIYGRCIEVRFLEKLRNEEKYASVDELVAQIGRDVEAARNYFRRRELLIG